MAEVEVDGSTRRGLGVNTPAVVVVGWASDRGKRRRSAVRYYLLKVVLTSTF